jgi:uncharacterized protein with NRDE domain
MCLAAFSLGQHPRYALVLLANRDEFFARAAAPLAWWADAPVLGGRDLQAGGGWLLLDRAGRLALVTNVREPGRGQPDLPSRGELPLAALRGEDLLALASEPRHGFNLLSVDIANGSARWVSNRPQPRERRLGGGLYGLSNAELDSPWPKAECLKQRLGEALAGELRDEMLFAALADEQQAPDAQLPATGLPLARERQLSSAFIRIAGDDGQALYGTRCSTLVIAERLPGGLLLRVRERRFSAQGGVKGESEQQWLLGS